MSEEKSAEPVKAYLNLTEANAKAALIESRGEIFIASQLLGVTAIRLQRAIQCSGVLQACLAALREADSGSSLEAINKAIESRTAIYRVVGLDALHDLATIDVNDPNSAKLQVKLAAAARLAGTVEGAGGGSEVAETLRELNRSYQENAPRLRVIREKVTIETIPPERVVGSGPPSE